MATVGVRLHSIFKIACARREQACLFSTKSVIMTQSLFGWLLTCIIFYIIIKYLNPLKPETTSGLLKKSLNTGCSKMLRCKAREIMHSQQPPAERVAWIPLKGEDKATKCEAAFCLNRQRRWRLDNEAYLFVRRSDA
jgi:hypothetical protein